jgi:hypothetical protein
MARRPQRCRADEHQWFDLVDVMRRGKAFPGRDRLSREAHEPDHLPVVVRRQRFALLPQQSREMGHRSLTARWRGAPKRFEAGSWRPSRHDPTPGESARSGSHLVRREASERDGSRQHGAAPMRGRGAHRRAAGPKIASSAQPDLR